MLERRDRFSSQGLDASFGNAGIAEQTFSVGPTFPQSVAVQSDGKLVVGGTVANVVGSNLVPSGFVLARYNADGTPDSSFATDGAVATNHSLDPFIGGVNDIIVESDGKLLAAGGDLARYNADGTLDTSFGVRGNASGGGYSIGLQSDGKILENGIDLGRYNPDGTPDTTFGTNGYIVLNATQFVVTPGDAIVTVAGNVLNRLTADGQVDTTFGDAGTVILPLPNGDSFQPTSLVLTANGKIDCVGNLPPAGGFFSHSPYSIAVFQLNSDGTLNQGFGNNGETIIRAAQIARVVIQWACRAWSDPLVRRKMGSTRPHTIRQNVWPFQQLYEFSPSLPAFKPRRWLTMSRTLCGTSPEIRATRSSQDRTEKIMG